MSDNNAVKFEKDERKETFLRLFSQFAECHRFDLHNFHHTILIAVIFAPVRFTLSPETL